MPKETKEKLSEGTGPDEHAKFNPSSLKLWEICPSYLNRPDQGVNPAAAMGTRVHDAMETGDPSKLEGDQEQELFELTSQAVEDILLEHFPKEDSTEFNEIRIHIDMDDDSTFGTCDKLNISVDGTLGVAIDYKFGLMSVDSADINAQVAAYSAGIFQRFPKLERLIFMLLIPRQDVITEARFSRKDGAEQLLRTKTTIRRAKELGGKAFNPQVNLCEFCGRQGTCKALAKKALLVAQRYGNDDAFPIPTEVRGDEHEDPETIGELLALARLLDGWSKGIWAQARLMAFEDGWTIPGFKTIEVKSKRSIKDPSIVLNLIGEESAYNITTDEFLDCVAGVSLGKLETAIKEKAPRGDKEKRWEEATDLLRDNEVLSGGDSTSLQLRVDRNYKK